jgi:hypothetical protein
MILDKRIFTNSLKDFLNSIKALSLRINTGNNKQIQSKELLSQIEVISEAWYNFFRDDLVKINLYDSNLIEEYSEKFGKLLELSSKNPSKSYVLEILTNILNNFSKDIIVKFQKDAQIIEQEKIFTELLNKLEGKELEYMKEAIECSEIKKYRASIIMGWCSAIYRIHKKIESIGFDKFNKASERMKNIKSGRYRRFEKIFSINNITELRFNVSDTDLLWVLEFLQIIDGNENDKLGICLQMRNMSAHPGDATMSFENVKSFFSDIKNVIFDNENFKSDQHQM